MHELPIIQREQNETEVLENAIIENIQRADLNAVEEALGYRQLVERFGHTQEQLAQALGKSRSHIANTLRLMTLPKTVLDQLQQGSLTAGHARALIATDDPAGLAQKIVALGLSVRQAEALARNKAEASDNQPAEPKGQSDLRAIERALSETLGLRVSLQPGAGEKGKLVINFKTLEQFEELCAKLGAKL